MFDDKGYDFTYCANAKECGERKRCYRGRGLDRKRHTMEVARRAEWANFYLAGDSECNMLVPYND